MRARWLLAPLALVAAAACETFEESYLVEREDLIDNDYVRVFSDLEEYVWDGGRFWQFTAISRADQPVCVQVALTGDSRTSGHSMGSIFAIPPNGMLDIGYVTGPADFGVDARSWSAQGDGTCGSPTR